MIVAGVPNVGKSTLINGLRSIYLRRKKSFKTAPFPGTTRGISNRVKVCDYPQINVFDTPGIIQPAIGNLDSRLKLCLCSMINENNIDKEIIADYLLFLLNKQKSFEYVNYYQLSTPEDSIHELLTNIARKFNKTQQAINIHTNSLQTSFNTNWAAENLLSSFRRGRLGKFQLE